MTLSLLQKPLGEVDELVEIAAGAKLRVDLRVDRVDADAQPFERRIQQLCSNLFGQDEPIRRHARLREETDGVVDPRVQERLPHLMQPLEFEAQAMDLAL